MPSSSSWWQRCGESEGFLSRENPLATVGQRAVEDRAIALLERPELQHARAIVTMLWKNVAAWPTRDQADLFPGMIDEYLFHHAMRAANGDPNFPEVARFMAPPHHWFGRDVPGSRWAGDSADFIYRTIPIAHGGRYLIRGFQTGAEPPLCFYSLMSENTASPQTLTLLEGSDMEFEPDGSFTISVDDTPADGRRNHIQTKPGSEFLMIRDALGDWLTQSANALVVERLDPDRGERSQEEMARHAARIAIESVYYTYYITMGGNALPPNELDPPMSTAALGAVATQWGSKARLELGEDEAMIVRCNAAGALFRNVQIFSLFMMTTDYWTRSSSLNMAQMTADEDGDFTYVIAHRDPGIANWLDTTGLRRMIFGQRWQAFDRTMEHPDPWMTTRLVAFRDLDKELPSGVKRIDASGRSAQLAAREAGFRRRFIDS